MFWIIVLSIVLIIAILLVIGGEKWDEDDMFVIGGTLFIIWIIVLPTYIYNMNIEEYYKKAEVIKIERVENHFLIVVKDKDPILETKLYWDSTDNIYIKVEVENNGDVIETIVNKKDIDKEDFVGIKGNKLE